MPRTKRARVRRALGQGDETPVTPTPQTAAKLRHDVVARLLAAGRLSPVHAEAAEEIRTVHEAVGRGMFPTSRAFAAGHVPRRAGPVDFLDRMTARERHLWQRRYLPWTRAMALEIAAPVPGLRWLQLVLDIVVDNVAPREVETRYRLRHGTAVDWLRGGLERYAMQEGADRLPGRAAVPDRQVPMIRRNQSSRWTARMT